jgi:hypothetical protein
MLFISCGQSREKKAEAIVKKVITPMLTNASSYEPIETKVDSAFENIYIDPDAVRAAYELLDLESKKEDLTDKLDLEKSSAAMNSNPYYMSEYEKESIRQANEKIDKLSKQLEKISAKENVQQKIIRDRNSKIKKSKFIGWIITQRFNSANGYGVKSAENIAILVDEKMEKSLMIYNLDNNAKDGMENIKDIIDDVLTNDSIPK